MSNYYAQQQTSSYRSSTSGYTSAAMSGGYAQNTQSSAQRATSARPPVPLAAAALSARTSLHDVNPRLVSQHTGEPYIVSTTEGEPRLVDVIQHESRVIEERVYEGESYIIKEQEMKRERKSQTRAIKKEEIRTEVVKRPMIIEMIKEILVPTEVYVEIVKDVVVDVPIERTIEREKITEIHVEKAIEKVIEIPIEQVIEIPVETLVEVPVKVQRLVERPYERIVEKPYEVIKENIIWSENVIDVDERDVGQYPGATSLPVNIIYEHNEQVVEREVYVEHIIQQNVEVPHTRVIEIPREHIVEKRHQVFIDQPKPVDRVIEEIVSRPVGHDIFRDVEMRVEQPVYCEHLIEEALAIGKLVQKETEVPVEHIVERPVFIENIVERPFDYITQIAVPIEEFIKVPIEKITEVEVCVERVTERPVEKIIRKSVAQIRRVPVEIDCVIERTVEVPVEHFIEKQVNRYIEVPVETVVERPVQIETTTEQVNFVEVTREVHLENVIENIETVEVVKEKPVYIDTVLEKNVEYLVMKDVEVYVEKEIEVPLTVHTERAVFHEFETYEEQAYENNIVEVTEDPNVIEEDVEVEDQEIAVEIEARKRDLEGQRNENFKLKGQLDATQREYNALMRTLSSIEDQENYRLLARFEELSSRLHTFQERRADLQYKVQNRQTVVETVVKKNPRGDTLKTRIDTLIVENNSLVSQIVVKGEQVLKKATEEANHPKQPRRSFQTSSKPVGLVGAKSSANHRAPWVQAAR